MYTSQLPILLASNYPGVTQLLREIVDVKDFASLYPGSAAAINTFLSAVAGVVAGGTLPASGTGTTATLVFTNGIATSVTLA